MILVLRFLFELLPKDSEAENVVTLQQTGGGGLPPMEAEDPFILWVILEYAAMIALMVVCAILLYRGIRRLIVFLRDKMQFSLPDAVSEKTSVADKREQLKTAPENTAAKAKIKWFSFAFLDAGQKIRRMYQKKINAGGLAKTSLPFYTARDAERSLGAEGMAEIYEKARYSDTPCTDADVRQMKNYM